MVLNELKTHASTNTICHALYGYYCLGYNAEKLSRIFKKSNVTILAWIKKYETDGTIGRKKDIKIVYKKFGHEKRKWLVDLYTKNPVLYLKEAQVKFLKKYGDSISATSVSVILHEAGLTWKVLERRAIQIKIKDVIRFCDEMTVIDWSWETLVFLDEVSFNGSDMLRKNGYGKRGQSLVYRGEFKRSARTSLLCFVGVDGLLESYETDGTFNRKIFAEFCRKFALENENVKMYPGMCSVWVMDGAKIHCSDKLIYYLRSLGIVVIFLPAYCPMMNPIEIVFGLIKGRLRKNYVENSKVDKNILLCEIVNQFTNMYMGPLFQHCGYFASGTFDPSSVFKLDLKKHGLQSSA